VRRLVVLAIVAVYNEEAAIEAELISLGIKRLQHERTRQPDNLPSRYIYNYAI
jgi:hypothetical protein